MSYQLDEIEGDILYEVKGDRLILKVKPDVFPPIPPGGGAEGGGGDWDTYIIKTNDLTVPTDENVFSSLRTLMEIEHVLIEANDMFLRKDINDVGYGFYTWEAGFMTKSTIRSAEYNIGWEVENPIGVSIP